MKRLVHFLALAISIGFLPRAADAAALPETDLKKNAGSAQYTFAVIPYYTPEKIWKLFTPFVDYLNKTTGQSWNLQLYNNHEEFVEDMCNGKISIALTGPVPLGRAYNKCGVKPMLVALGKSGKPSYHSVLITNDPEVRNISDLKGRKIGLFKGSTAAHILPVKMLKSSGIKLSETKPIFLESQDRIVSALMAGELSAGGMKETLYQRLGKANLRVLATSEEVPNFALAALPSFPAKVREKVMAELRTIKPLTNANHAELVKNWDDEVKNGFTEPGKDFLPSILNLYSVFWEVTNEPR